MHASNRPTWGPSPMYAVVPVILAVGLAASVWAANGEPLPSPSGVAVTVLKPVHGAVAAVDTLPIDVVYGVPSERTIHLWRPVAAAD